MKLSAIQVDKVSLIAMVLALVFSSVRAQVGYSGKPANSGDAIRSVQQRPSSKPDPPYTQGNQDVEILSDTRGVDFGPYVKQILKILYAQWVQYLPQEVRPFTNQTGNTLIRFTIGKDGVLTEMHLDASSHHEGLDRAAWGAVTQAKFPPLPAVFTGPTLQLRMHFLVGTSPTPGAQPISGVRPLVPGL